jgi:hypothetical protein
LEGLVKRIAEAGSTLGSVCSGVDVVLTFFFPFRSKELSTMETETEVKTDAPAATETPVVAATEEKEEEPVEKVRRIARWGVVETFPDACALRDSSWTTPSSRR